MSERDPYQSPTPDEEIPELTPGLAIALTLSASFLSLVVAAALSPSPRVSPGVLGIAVIAGYGAAFALARPFIADPPGPALGFVWAPGRTWVAAGLFLPSVLLLSELENVAATVFPRPEMDPGREPIPTDPAFVGQLIVTGMLAQPLAHEIFFRGLLQPRLVPRWGSGGAVLGTALLTMLAALPFHVPAWSTLVLPLGYGLLLGTLRRAAGSIYPGLALAMSYGAISVGVYYEAFDIPGFDRVEEGAHTPIGTLVVPALLLGIGLSLCRGEPPAPGASSRKHERRDSFEH